MFSSVASVDYSLSRATSIRDQMSRFYFLLCLSLRQVILLQGAELWEKDLTSFMKIGLSTTGYGPVSLSCGLDHFSFNITLPNDFRGVVYTRGSFKDQKLPCFKRHHQKTPTGSDSTIISLRIPFDKCGTIMDVAESHCTNTVVVQYDPDLIMPGDAAFTLDCAFEPEFKVTGNLNVETSPFKSRITLVDADPSKETPKTEDSITVSSKSDTVTFVSDSGDPKDEL